MKTILVVDDEAAMREVIEDALDSTYTVTTVANGKEALEKLAGQKFDLLITDLVMPEMNGIDLMMGLQKNNPEQKIIAISGGGGINGRFDYLPVAKLIGACTVLRKPFTMTQLRDAVNKMMA